MPMTLAEIANLPMDFHPPTGLYSGTMTTRYGRSQKQKKHQYDRIRAIAERGWFATGEIDELVSSGITTFSKIYQPRKETPVQGSPAVVIITQPPAKSQINPWWIKLFQATEVLLR